jgi:hypothetical protein
MQINYSKTKNVEEAYKAVKGKINHETLAKMNIKAEITCDDQRPSIVAKGKGFTVTISFHNDYCRCDVDLSLMLKPFKSRIEDSLKRDVFGSI